MFIFISLGANWITNSIVKIMFIYNKNKMIESIMSSSLSKQTCLNKGKKDKKWIKLLNENKLSN